MKNALCLLAALSVCLCGCRASRDKYDIATDQVKQHRAETPGPVIFDDANLAKDGNVEEVTIKKGDKLPDGNTATEDMTTKTFTGSNDQQLQWTTPKKSKN